MPDYKIRSNGFKEIRKQILTRLLIFTSLIAAGSLAITIFNSKEKQDYVIVLPIMIVLMVIVFGFSIYRALKKQKQLLDSYALTINDNTVTRYQLNTPTISLYHNEIKEISKTSNGSFIIKGKDAEDVILIPAQIDSYANLEASLNQIKPIIFQKSKPIFEKYPVLNVIVMIGLMFGVYVSMNKIIVATCGILITAIMGWSFYKVQKSKNVEHRIKRISWLLLIVLFSIIYVIILKLTGHYPANKT